MSHVDDLDLLKRLRRAEGHLGGVVRMVSEGRDALAIVQQMQAVIRALEEAKRHLVLHHIDHHLAPEGEPASPELRARLAALRDIAKYL
jgi:DNA-binding FrmR family transcriptional regulator